MVVKTGTFRGIKVIPRKPPTLWPSSTANAGCISCGATIAAEAEELLASIAEQVERERRQKQAESQSGEAITQTFVEQPNDTRSENKTSHQAASMFGTNRTYLNAAGSTFTVTA